MAFILGLIVKPSLIVMISRVRSLVFLSCNWILRSALLDETVPVLRNELKIGCTISRAISSSPFFLILSKADN